MTGAVPDPAPARPRSVLRERLLAAQCLSRLLAPSLHAQGGWVSGVLRLHLPGWQRPRWPLLAVHLGDPPVDGLLRTAPALVVDRAGEVAPRDYLESGAEAVWVVRGGSVSVHRAGWPVKVVGAGAACPLLGTGLTVPAERVLALLPEP